MSNFQILFIISETCDPSIQCPETVRMVCANNGKTYINECTMKKEACRLNTNLQIVDLGSCEDEREGSTSGGNYLLHEA